MARCLRLVQRDRKRYNRTRQSNQRRKPRLVTIADSSEDGGVEPDATVSTTRSISRAKSRRTRWNDGKRVNAFGCHEPSTHPMFFANGAQPRAFGSTARVDACKRRRSRARSCRGSRRGRKRGFQKRRVRARAASGCGCVGTPWFRETEGARETRSKGRITSAVQFLERRGREAERNASRCREYRDADEWRDELRRTNEASRWAFPRRPNFKNATREFRAAIDAPAGVQTGGGDEKDERIVTIGRRNRTVGGQERIG